MIETTELYGGKIQIEFNPVKHTYAIVNKGKRFKVPSVTRITSVLDKSGPLVGWAVNCTLDVCREAVKPGVEYAETYLEAVWKAAKSANANIKQEAALRGRAQHEAIERDLSSIGTSSILSSLSERIGPVRILSVERRVYSRRFRYSGTYDCIGFVGEESDRKLVLLDWKTSKSIYPEFRLQTAAYDHAYEEEFPDQKIAGRYLVRIAEDGSVEPHFYPRSTLRKDFQAFLGAKALFDRVQQIEKESKK